MPPLQVMKFPRCPAYGRSFFANLAVMRRMCAVKKSSGLSGNFRSDRELVENTWPVVAGVVAWEFESYTRCCLRGD